VNFTGQKYNIAGQKRPVQVVQQEKAQPGFTESG
jgi:hypothetical protein